MKILLRKNKIRLRYVVSNSNDIKKIISLNDKQDNSKICKIINAVNLIKEYLKKGAIKWINF